MCVGDESGESRSFMNGVIRVYQSDRLLSHHTVNCCSPINLHQIDLTVSPLISSTISIKSGSYYCRDDISQRLFTAFSFTVCFDIISQTSTHFLLLMCIIYKDYSRVNVNKRAQTNKQAFCCIHFCIFKGICVIK